ncbi:thermonuclease family protein [Paracoccus jiaweipingae]|uniref:thermonuclease family protein n=1 Tax=unclassified Paracoccus (in: a-proteobacteria) TaxID=2688777 RepID=UPI0037BA9593
MLCFRLFLLCCVVPVAAVAADLSGRARVTDGDTLRLDMAGGTAVIRLFGIDAPEAAQTCQNSKGQDWTCGKAATQYLRGLVDGHRLRCTMLDTDRYGRIVARCFRGQQDIAAQMVLAGQAVAFRRYSMDYVPPEDAARAKRRGIWAGKALRPKDWRARHRAPASATTRQAAPSAGCRIKGNISANGHIYHLPGDRHYDRTRINTRKGERWFCSEEEARRAGWRPV